MREPICPFIGRLTIKSQLSLTSLPIPSPSEPIIKAAAPVKSVCQISLCPSAGVSQHLSRLFTEEHTLADANTAAWLMQHLDESFKQEIEDNVYYDRYENLEELIDDIRIRTDQAISDGDIGMGGM